MPWNNLLYFTYLRHFLCPQAQSNRWFFLKKLYLSFYLFQKIIQFFIIYFFQIGLFHSAICIYSLSMSFYGSVAHFFLSLNDILLFVCITVVFFTPMERELGCFWLFTIRSKVAINICMLAFFFFLIFFFFFICSEFCHTLKWKGLGFTLSSPSRSPLPPPSPPTPSRSSQSTRSECLSHASNLGR